MKNLSEKSGAEDLPAWARRGDDRPQHRLPPLTDVSPASPLLRVSVVPNHPVGLKNRLFAKDFMLNSHWMDANLAWHECFAKAGIELATADMLPPESSDVVIIMDLPSKKSELLELKCRAPKAKFLLLLYESPFDRPHWFDGRNHTEFDAVLTYNRKLVDGRRYQHFQLPIGLCPTEIPDIPFEDRGGCVLLNTNHYLGLRAAARPWHWLLKYRNLKRAGWHFRLADIIRVERCINYSGRQKIARAAERLPGGFFDVYGGNWGGRNSGWYYRFFPDAPYKAAKGVHDAEKLSLLSRYRFAIAYENYLSDEGYISEKIFDALYAGTVPVYLGEQRIADYVHPECFVDARQFKSDLQLLEFLQGCSVEEWRRMREAGRSYLRSEKIKAFQPQHYAETMLQIVCAMTSNQIARQ